MARKASEPLPVLTCVVLWFGLAGLAWAAFAQLAALVIGGGEPEPAGALEFGRQAAALVVETALGVG